MSNQDKKIKIMMLLSEIYVFEPMLKFFDIDSDKMLDEKIEVLTDLKNGKKPIDIPNFYDILELYPTGMWD